MAPKVASSALTKPRDVRIVGVARMPMGGFLGSNSSLSATKLGSIAIELPPITTASWQSLVLDSDTPVLVEFWAPLCGPCRMIQPVIDDLAKQYAGKLKCYKVNTDESPSIATQYGIRSILMVIIFKSGEKKDAVIA